MAVAEPTRTTEAIPHEPVVLYDGECGLCHRSVKFILRHEADHELRFAPLQGELAKALRARHPTIPTNVDTDEQDSEDQANHQTKANQHVAKHLRRPWRWAYAVRWLPGFVLD